MSFNKGDVVMLKSGGPKMTVTGVVGQDRALDITSMSGYEQGDVSVEYFAKDRLEKQMFKATSIVLATEE